MLNELRTSVFSLLNKNGWWFYKSVNENGLNSWSENFFIDALFALKWIFNELRAIEEYMNRICEPRTNLEQNETRIVCIISGSQDMKNFVKIDVYTLWGPAAPHTPRLPAWEI